MDELTPIKRSKVSSNNKSLVLYIPKKIRKLAGFSKGDYVKWYFDPATKRVVLEKSEFREPDFPPKTAQDSKEAEEEKNG